LISFPNCKINIGLHVLEKRSDGFHNIETILYPVGWSDILEIVPTETENQTTDIRCTGMRVFGTREKNLCIRAYQLLAKDHSLPPLKMHLHKLVPVGAGLGGGSSDGVHALMLINKITGLRLAESEIEKYASQLGSDCAFFINNKPVLAMGKGDEFEPIKLKTKKIFCVIVKPGVHVSTAAAYSWIKPKKRKESLKDLIQRPMSEWEGVITNDFEKIVSDRFPVVKNIKSRLYKLGAVYAAMTGSGSGVFGFFQEEKQIRTYFRSSTFWSGWL